MTGDDDMFSRWSQRKRRVAEEEAREVPASTGPEPVSSVDEDEDETAVLERLKLPVPESMKPGDDFSVFMRAGVPEFLRKRALKVLWRSNPVLACVDGLNDYDDDFTSPEMTKKVLATAYKVGRGFLPPEPEPEILQENTEDLPGEADDSPEVVAEEPAVASRTAEQVDQFGGSMTDSSDEDELSFQPKRMRFQT